MLRLSDVSDVQQLMWHIEDSVVQLKHTMAEVVVTWNAKIQDLVPVSKRREEKHRKNDGGKPPAPTSSHSLEYDKVCLKNISLRMVRLLALLVTTCIASSDGMIRNYEMEKY
jgi:hypothetical protein